MTAPNPYSDLPRTAFWNSGVANASPLSPEGVYTRKWRIPPSASIATAGSCFAQHVARHLRMRGARVIDAEPAPAALLPERRSAYGYGMYSARYGNIYTVAQLAQLLREVRDGTPPGNIVWEKDGRFYDALRPGVEPEGLASADEVLEHRRAHVEAVGHVFREADVLVFTLGLTEAWVDRETGTVYPTAPGTIAGTWDPERYAFRNYDYPAIVRQLREVFALAAEIRGPQAKPLRTILTVSPVPLTATASGQHVLPATMLSKSILRAVAGHFAEKNPAVDYFPSYEIIVNQAARGVFYEANLRSVRNDAVEIVMQCFFDAHPTLRGTGGKAAEAGRGAPAPGAGKRGAPSRAKPEPAGDVDSDNDVKCEEALLEAFGK